MDPISVCIIAKNEEDHIEACLKRLKPLRFEIILVDTGSTDRTIELASQYTDKIYQFEWCDDFSAARNFSIKQASNDWVLIIDCDEYMENANILELEEAMEANPTGVGMISRNNPYKIMGNRSIMKERIERLFNRNHCHFEGRIHEQVKCLDGSDPNTFPIPVTFYHEGYVTESGKRQRAARNLEMILQTLPEKGESPYLYYQLGQNYLSLNDTPKAKESFAKGLELGPDNRSNLGRSLAEAYGYCLLESDNVDEKLSLLDYYPAYSNHADFVFLTGMIYMECQEPEKALAEFQKATQMPKCARKGVNSYRAYYHIGQIYETLNQTNEAISAYAKCGDFEPAAVRLRELEA